jgi:hypothetical protein
MPATVAIARARVAVNSRRNCIGFLGLLLLKLFQRNLAMYEAAPESVRGESLARIRVVLLGIKPLTSYGLTVL